MKTADLAFNFGQRVEIHEPGHKGNISSITLDREGIQYKVDYWFDGVRNSVWVNSYELSAIRTHQEIVK